MGNKKKKDSKTVNIAELVKQRPVLNEEEMKEFATYEEIVSDALRLFDEEVQRISNEYVQNKENNNDDKGIISQEEIDQNEWLSIDEARAETIESIRKIYESDD